MSATNLIEVPITQTSYERLLVQANAENRTITDVVEDSLRQTEERRVAFQRMSEAIDRMREEAIVNGTSDMTMEEINEEIALMHRERAAAALLKSA